MLALLLTLSVHAQDIAPPNPESSPTEEAEPPPLTRLPELLEFVQAPYPQTALEAGTEGVVGLLIQIDASGAVTQAEVIRSLTPELDAAALEVAPQLRFSPAEDENGPTPVMIEFDYGFVLDSATNEAAVPQDDETVEAPVNFEGLVLEMATRRPLAEMGVLLVETEISTETDADGRFSLRGVPLGKHTLRIARPGWRTLERQVEITENELVSIELWVKNDSWTEDEAVGVYRKAREEVTRRTISVQEVRRIPGTFGDPVRVIQNLPGAARAPFGSGGLLIRGANPEDSAVYIDGIRIPLIYHLGGYVSVFNADLLESVDYLPGGYGVQYGRSLGGVVDVSTRKESPEQPRLSWSTDILDSGGLFEGRLGKDGQHHVAIAARRSYVDLLLPTFLKNTGVTALPRWYDYQLRYHHKGIWDVTALVFGFGDSLFLSTDPDIPQGVDADTQGAAEIFYGTHRGLVNLEREFSDNFSMRLVPSFGVDLAEFGLGSTFDIEQDQWLIEVRAEANWRPHPKVEIIPGVDFLGGWYTFNVGLPFSPTMELDADPTQEREPVSFGDDGSGWGPDFYLKTQIRPLADPDDLLLTAGMRTSIVTVVDQYTAVGLDPRFSARHRLFENTWVKGSAGIYTQPPQPFEGWAPEGDIDIDFEQAASASLGVEQSLGQATTLEMEGFYKDLSDLVVENSELTDYNTQASFVNEGVGRIYGLEAMLRRDPVDDFFGWVSYTLSRSERLDHPKHGDTQWYPFDFDQTHIFVALAGVELPRAWRASGRFRYITGNPYTPYELGVYNVDEDSYTAFPSGDPNSDRLPDFYSLDLRTEKRLTFKKWRLDLYVDVLNAVRGENAEYVNYNYDYTEQRWIKGLPLIPSFGFEAEIWL
ncbi:MAG: TonB family protein [Myxococcota bacterium]|nr:TonB family protein [Myxococcota bacterium]